MSQPPKAVKLPSPLERLELILLGLGRREPATKLCEQAGVSRELFYRWMRAVREAGLRALEAKAPGPKRVQEETAPKEALRMRERVARLEKELRKTRKERDHWKLLAEVGRRIIRRQGWGPAPRAASKKNATPSPGRGRYTSRSGRRSGPEEPEPQPSPGAGESAEAPIGGGRPASSEGQGPES